MFDRFERAEREKQDLQKQKADAEAKKKAELEAQKARDAANLDNYVKSIRSSGRFLGLDENGEPVVNLMPDLSGIEWSMTGRRSGVPRPQPTGEAAYAKQIKDRLKQEELAKQDVKQQDVLKTAEKNYIGMDDQGNAIFKDDAGQLSGYGGKDWSKVTDTVKKLYGDRSYGDYVGNEQLNSLGADFQGIDKETGAAVFSKGGETFGIAKDDPEFKNMYKVAQNRSQGKTWVNPEYEKSFNEIQSQGKSFKGLTDDNKAIFQNQLGQYETLEDQDNPILKFAKYKLENQKFKGPEAQSADQGGIQSQMGSQSDASKASRQFASKMAFQPKQGGFSRFQQSQQAQTSPAQPNVDLGAMYNAPDQDQFQTQGVMNYRQPTSQQAQQTNAYTPRTLPQPPSMQDQLLNMGKSMAEKKINQTKTQVENVAKQKAKQALDPYKQKIAGQIQDATGFNPFTSIQDQATKKAEGYGKNLLTQQFGSDNVGLAQNVADILKGNVGQNLTDYGKKEAISQGIGALSDYTGMDAGLLGKGVGLLQGGNVLDNAKRLAEDQAKKQALSSAANYMGIDPSMISGALDIGKNLFSGGMSHAGAEKLGETAARAGLASLTGGLVTPETAMIASKLGEKGYDLSKKALGNTAGSIVGAPLKVGSAGAKAGGEILGAGIGSVGQEAANVYDAAKRGVGGLKMLASGDVGKGVSEVGKALGNFASKSLIKQPVALAKSVIKSVGRALSSLNPFCFDGNVQIRMKDGSIKKAKDIKVGDELAIGGRVIGCGEALSNEMHYYGDVLVSGAYAVFENGKWLRVQDSKLSNKVDLGEHKVYPIACENHIIITKDNQVWADMTEIDDTSSYTDEERIQKLNTMKRKNKMLKVFLNANKKV